MTVDDLKRMKASANQEKEDHLMTKELKNRNRQRQRTQDYDRYPECLLKINFVNNITLEMVFHPGEPVSNVKNEIAKIIENDIRNVPEQIELFTTPPKIILEQSTTIWDAGLCPRGNCYVSNKDIKIKSDVWSTRITQFQSKTSEYKTSNCDKPGTSSKSEVGSSSGQATTHDTSNTSNNTSNKDKYSSKADGKTIPKWFKGTGKSYK